MKKFHQLAEDDPVWTANQPLTVGSMARAMSDAKTALAETRKLSEDVDDLDALIADIEKSTTAHRATIKAIEAGSKTTADQIRATADEIAKLRASLDTAGTLAKAKKWERGFFERQYAAEVKKGLSISFEDYLERIEADGESFRKCDAVSKYDFDDDGVLTFERRPDSQWRVVR